MNIAGIYSFNRGRQIIEARYGAELGEINEVIASIKGDLHKTKTSHERTMPGRKLYSPKSLNEAFAREFLNRGWEKFKVECEYPTEYFLPEYRPATPVRGAFREMDFVKNQVGIEVQFGKYAFMVYNVCAKMTIFHKMGVIDVGVEIVPIKAMANEMSTGVSYFEQFVWDLEHRGVADIDIPVLILGITV